MQMYKMSLLLAVALVAGTAQARTEETKKPSEILAIVEKIEEKEFLSLIHI